VSPAGKANTAGLCPAAPALLRQGEGHQGRGPATDHAPKGNHTGAVWLRPRDRRQNRSARALLGKANGKGLGAHQARPSPGAGDGPRARVGLIEARHGAAAAQQG